jgi:HSP20 family molecular chaperone IbpA
MNYDPRDSRSISRDPYYNTHWNTYDGDNWEDRRSQSHEWLDRGPEDVHPERRGRFADHDRPEYYRGSMENIYREDDDYRKDLDRRNRYANGRASRGEYNPRTYREDFGADVNYGERYGFSGYGRSRYNPDINRGWQEDPDVQSWRENQPFMNREQDYRGGRWSRATRGYERGPSMSEYGTTGQYGRGRYSGVGPKNYRRTDSRVEEEVCERLMEHPEIDASNIEVKVSNGEVTLSGTVNNRTMKHAAEDILDSISGVRDVNNQIRVKSSISDGASQPWPASQEFSGTSSQRTNGHGQEKRAKT